MSTKIEEAERALRNRLLPGAACLLDALMAAVSEALREAREEGHMQGCRDWAALFGVRDDESVREYKERTEAESFERGVAAERAAVLKRLRSRLFGTSGDGGRLDLDRAADAIEHGYHSEHSDALDRVREQVRAETLASCAAVVKQHHDEWYALAMQKHAHSYLRKECLDVVEAIAHIGEGLPAGADALARREQAAAVRALREAADMLYNGEAGGLYDNGPERLLRERAAAIEAEAAP